MTIGCLLSNTLEAFRRAQARDEASAKENP